MNRVNLPRPVALAATLSLAVLGLGLTGCTVEEPEEQPSTPQATTAQASDTATEPTPETPASAPQAHSSQDTTQDTSETHIEADTGSPQSGFTPANQSQQSADWPTLTDAEGVYATGVRAAIHDGYERVVIDHAGTGTPSFLAEYVDHPVADGSGAVLSEASTAYLAVTLSGTSDIFLIDEDEALDNNYSAPNLATTHVTEVITTLPWEATSTYYIGLDQQLPYRVSVLENPTRLVVDIDTTAAH